MRAERLPRAPRRAAVGALAGVIVGALLLTGCSSATTAPPVASPLVATSAPSSDAPAPLPEASLGAQEATFVGVTMYLKSLADVAQKVTVSVVFRDNGKKFASARVSQTLRPHERSSVLVKPDYTGPVPQGYVSAITSLKATVTDVPASRVPEPVASSPEAVAPSFSNSPEPTLEGTIPSEGPTAESSDATSAQLIESAGDYVCHAGIANLPSLKRGSPTSTDVQALQVLLDQLGYSPGPIDGQFGKRTEAAVRAFQADQKLAADGQVGPLTWTAIVNGYC